MQSSFSRFTQLLCAISAERQENDMEAEKKQQELTEMMQVIFKNEKALDFIHGFVKAFIGRYL